MWVRLMAERAYEFLVMGDLQPLPWAMVFSGADSKMDQVRSMIRSLICNPFIFGRGISQGIGRPQVVGLGGNSVGAGADRGMFSC
jgi:hypothetical protein